MRRPLFFIPALLLASATAMASGYHRHGNRTISFDDDFDGGVADCSAMRVQFDGERVPVVSENVAIGNVRSLRVRSDQNGGIRVVGSRTGGYAVTACKAAGVRSEAGQVRVNVSGNEVSATGPDSDNWVVYFIVQTPRSATVDLTTTNGPIGVYEFDGTLTARARNGPLGIKDSTGTIDGSTVNGPISIDGGSGNVKLTATNGPLAVRLEGTAWLGGSLDASTQNGPLSLKLPRAYRSGVTVESSGHGPVSCHAEGCAAARLHQTDDYDDDRPRRIELGSGASQVHLSTVNGPISVKDRE